MKKFSFLMVTILLVSLLSACTGSTTPAPANSNPAADAPAAGAPVAAQGTPNPAAEQSGELVQERDLPDSFKLALGTMKLEETSFPVSQQQAQALLPYWKALSALTQSDSTAIQEVEAVLKQIQNQMTAEQLAAIDGMEMSMADLTTLAEKLGLTLSQDGAMPGFNSLSEEERATRQAMRDSGQVPSGGMGPGSGMGAGGGAGEIPGSAGVPIPKTTQSVSGVGGGVGLSLGVNPRLLAAVVEFLELRAGG